MSEYAGYRSTRVMVLTKLLAGLHVRRMVEPHLKPVRRLEPRRRWQRETLQTHHQPTHITQATLRVILSQNSRVSWFDLCRTCHRF